MINKKLKTIKRLIQKTCVIICLVSLLFVPPTASYYSDTETSEGNTLASTSLDLVLSSPQENFTPSTSLTPGDHTFRTFQVENAGLLPFEYTLEYEFVSGDSDLCDALTLSVNPLSQYFGNLTSYHFASYKTLHSLQTETYEFDILLNQGAPSTVRNKSCTFNIKAQARQIGLSGNGFSDVEVLQSTVTSGTWPPPPPTLLYPADNTIAAANSPWTLDPYMDWEDVSWADPVTYIYQSALSPDQNPDGSFVSPAYTSVPLTSSQIPAPGTPDGTYYWHVQTCDVIYGCGDFSETWSLTVDRTIEQGQEGDVVINEIMWMGSTSSAADEWIELRNTTSGPINLKNWVITNAQDTSTPDLVLPALTIPADGYLLISNYDSTDPQSMLNVVPDLVTTTIEFVNTSEKLTLLDSTGKTIDQTPEPSGNWVQGVNNSLKQSMERNDIPESGLDSTNWHTCTDPLCNDTTYWDTEGDNYGTPKDQNHSLGDPTDPLSLITLPLQSPSPSPSPTPSPLASTTPKPTPTPSPTSPPTQKPQEQSSHPPSPTPTPVLSNSQNEEI